MYETKKKRCVTRVQSDEFLPLAAPLWLLLLVVCSLCALCPFTGTHWLNDTGFALAPGSSSWAAFTFRLPARRVLTGGWFNSRAWLASTVVVVVVVCVSAQRLHDGAKSSERPLAFRTSCWSPLLPMMPLGLFGLLCLLIGALVDLLVEGDPQFEVLRCLPARRGRLQGALGAGGNFLTVCRVMEVARSIRRFTFCSFRVARCGGGVVTDTIHRLGPAERERQLLLSCGGWRGGEVLPHHQIKVVWDWLLLRDWQVGWPIRSHCVWDCGSLVFTFFWRITIWIRFTQGALHDLFESREFEFSSLYQPRSACPRNPGATGALSAQAGHLGHPLSGTKCVRHVLPQQLPQDRVWAHPSLTNQPLTITHRSLCCQHHLWPCLHWWLMGAGVQRGRQRLSFNFILFHICFVFTLTAVTLLLLPPTISSCFSLHQIKSRPKVYGTRCAAWPPVHDVCLRFCTSAVHFVLLTWKLLKMLHALGFTAAVTAAAHMGGSERTSSQQSLTLFDLCSVFVQGVTTIVALTVLTGSTDTPEKTHFLDSRLAATLLSGLSYVVVVCVCYLGDLEGVPSALLGSISLCSLFCRVILSAACLQDEEHRRTQREKHSTICAVCHLSIN